MTTIGVLALQGDFAEHLTILKHIGAEVVEVRLPYQLADLDGLIIPGGKSTTIGKLAVAYDLMEPLRRFGQEQGHLGHLCGSDLPLERCPPPPAAAAVDGYHRRAQCLWPSGGQF